jgi:hypothetical protein
MLGDRELGFMSASALIDAYRRKTLSPVMPFWSTDSMVPRILSVCVAAIVGVAKAVIAASMNARTRVMSCPSAV